MSGKRPLGEVTDMFAADRRRLAVGAFAAVGLTIVLLSLTGALDLGELSNAAGGTVLNPGIIEKGPTMRLAGSHTFSARGGRKDVSWSVDREERAEVDVPAAHCDDCEPDGTTVNLPGQVVRFPDVASARGSTATFYLPKIAGRETVYVIKARSRSSEDVQRVQVFGPGRAVFVYESAGNPPVPVFATIPSSLSSATHLLVVMHGTSRNAEGYCKAWGDWPLRHDYVVVCPMFDKIRWPEPFQGNVFAERDGQGAQNHASKWTFTIVDDLQRILRQRFGLRDKTYDLYGHSGGGQFVHRFILFKPQSPVRIAIAANPGFYTLPDLAWRYPYGPSHRDLSFTKQDLVAWTDRNMVILRGCLDVDRDKDLRTTPQADAQGRNRFERARYMFDKGRALNPNLRWRLREAPGASHSNAEMVPWAQPFLTSSDPLALPPSLCYVPPMAP